ncbi:MAG TPA: NADPH:quinone reductase [Thermoleophilaceae bacterium]|nr:NADPH:quinone reductase [Thermoleophilaceae bacterium]
MRAAYYKQTGPASAVIEVGELPTPEPGEAEVRVRIAFSGINPTDWKSRAGATGGVNGEFQVPNHDGSGTIDAVGPGVDPGRVGERVWLYLAAFQQPWGTAAEYTVVPAERAVPLPDNASLELGASIGVPALTAHRCLLADGPIEGKTVLVAGGAGAVGRCAIELARWAGAARIIATVSNDDKAQIARDASADETVDYKAGDAVEHLKDAGVDRIVELSLGHNLELDLAAAAPNCAIASYANEGDNPELDVRALMTRNIVLRFVLLYTMPREAIQQAVADITQALRVGALTEPQLHGFPLEETAAAHDAVENGAVGKVLIKL